MQTIAESACMYIITLSTSGCIQIHIHAYAYYRKMDIWILRPSSNIEHAKVWHGPTSQYLRVSKPLGMPQKSVHDDMVREHTAQCCPRAVVTCRNQPQCCYTCVSSSPLPNALLTKKSSHSSKALSKRLQVKERFWAISSAVSRHFHVPFKTNFHSFHSLKACSLITSLAHFLSV